MDSICRCISEETNTDKAKSEKDVAECNIEFRIPATVTEPVKPSFKTNLILRASRYGEQFKENPVANSIAQIRNSRMVARYHKPGQKY